MSHIARVLKPGDRLRRGVDIAAGTVLLLASAPICIGAGVAVAVETRRWPIFSQARVGFEGRVFRIYKFRTMRPNCDQTLPKVRGDGRVTRTGKVLRRTSIDEIPQAWNLMRGNMTLVGPRPELLSQLALYKPEDYRRFDVVPGLTGLWQVSGRSQLSFDTKLVLDLRYVDTRSWWLDARILARTPLIVVRGHGAF